MISWEAAVQELRSDPSMERLVRECYFDDPLSSALIRYSTSLEWEGIQALIRAELGPAPGYAVEIGAGRGLVSFALSQMGWRVSAVEPDPSTIVGAGAIRSWASASGAAVDVISGYAESVPLADGTADLVIMRQALHHSSDIIKACEEVRRVLRPGGVFLALREHVLLRPSDLASFQSGHPLHHRYGGEHAYTLDAYLASFAAAGLTASRTLGPLSSDINTAPKRTTDYLPPRFRTPVLTSKLTSPLLTSLLSMWGHYAFLPGSLYTFVVKRVGEGVGWQPLGVSLVHRVRRFDGIG